ncbi:hypothetical protein CEXT_605521 [Caerostris extrusa]|uniref:Uncharacterized protein n=1 Tax=Caerostris extrusa TaxID=172846 RepID=A0AAV4RWC5_CAEEX|nr:hypothetical protein CEXT_605521 [Caerostris extrusa]
MRTRHQPWAHIFPVHLYGRETGLALTATARKSTSARAMIMEKPTTDVEMEESKLRTSESLQQVHIDLLQIHRKMRGMLSEKLHAFRNFHHT